MCTDIRIGGIYFAILALPLLTVRAAADDEIQKAVQRGVEFLQAHPSANGMWTFDDHGHTVGVSALVGLALLECEVPASDPVIQNAAEAVRKRVASIDDTYDISLAVMFLDRLAAAEDGQLIQTCCMRLVAGQTPRGGWGYSCPKISSEAELRRLRTALLKKDAAKRDRGTEKQQPPVQGDLLNNQIGHFTPRGLDDNSNTQFATLALWIARRHDVKADAALSSVEARFRRSQNADGGWSYMPVARAGMPGGMLGSTGSMTCAGLLGLAVGYGVATQAVLRTNINQKQGGPAQKEGSGPDANRDVAIQRGLAFLGQIMQPGLAATENGDSPDAQGPDDRRGFGGRRGARPGGMQRRGAGSSVLHNGLGSEYYFLWSVERVAVLYGLETIGNKDWFTIGSKYLLQEQSDDGAWRGNLGEVVDTCFALFFLRRANLAGDLTSTLRGKIRDPGTVSLRADKPVKEVAQNRKGAEPKAADEKSVAKDSGRKPNREALRLEPTEPRDAPPRPSVPQNETQTHEQEVGRLRDQLAKASPPEQASLLEKLRDGKGSVNTDALAVSIPQLSEAAKTKARDALAERLARMTAATIRDKLKDSNVEVRRAAALACAMKDDKSFVPDLIRLMEDSELRVTRAAHAALKTLTSADFGPANRANGEERKQAIARWRQWWEATKK